MLTQRQTLWAIGVAIAVLLIAGLGTTRLLVKTTSYLSADRTEFDFGVVSSQLASHLQHEFALTNTSAKDLRIANIVASCGCTTVDVSDRVIHAHQSLSIPVKVDWADRDGLQSARVTIDTDELFAPPIVFKLKGRVNNPLSIWPRDFDFGDLPSNHTSARAFAVKWQGDEPFHIINIESPDPGITVQRIDSEQLTIAGRAGRFLLHFDPIRHKTLPYNVIYVTTSSSKVPIALHYKYHILPSLSATPSSLLFRWKASAPDPQIVTIALVTTPANAFSARIIPETAASFCEIQTLATPTSNKPNEFRLQLSCVKRPRTAQMLHLRVALGNENCDIPIAILNSN